MRSLLSALVLAFAACGTDAVDREPPLPPPDPEVCETSYLRFDNFAAGFSASWCRGCHSSSIEEGGRQGAPLGVDFDTEADLVQWADRIAARATGDKPTMPPAGGPADEERALLAEWIGCGMQ